MHSDNIYIDRVSDVRICDEDYIMFSGTSYIAPYTVNPSEGKHNLESCEGCRKQRDHIIAELNRTESNFPNCCERHKKLVNIPSFEESHFTNVSGDIANKIMYVHHHIINNLHKPDWYKDIGDYIDYVIKSFGSFPKDYGAPYQISNFYAFFKHLSEKLKMEISTSDELDRKEISVRIDDIIGFVDSKFTLYDPRKKTKNNNEVIGNFNKLLNTYSDWYRMFPFELSYFKHLKPWYTKNIPILNGREYHNEYMGDTTSELHTVESLIDVLLKITKDIITNINGAKLYEKGLLDDTSNIKLELILQNRQLELSEIKLMDTSTNISFVKVLKKWFKTEKKFVNEITPFLKKEEIKSNGARPNRTDIAYQIHYLEQTKTLDLKNPFPSEKAWKEIGENYNKNSKNIQQAYNIIATDKDKRLSKTKKTNIKFVIENMLKEHPKGLRLAKDELKLVELNS